MTDEHSVRFCEHYCTTTRAQLLTQPLLHRLSSPLFVLRSRSPILQDRRIAPSCSHPALPIQRPLRIFCRQPCLLGVPLSYHTLDKLGSQPAQALRLGEAEAYTLHIYLHDVDKVRGLPLTLSVQTPPLLALLSPVMPSLLTRRRNTDSWVMLSETEGFTPLPGEQRLYTSPPRTSLSLQSVNKFPGHEPYTIQSSSGCVHLTNRRVCHPQTQSVR